MSTTEIEAAAEDVPGVSSVVALPDSTSGEVWLVVNGPVTPQAVLHAVGTRLVSSCLNRVTQEVSRLRAAGTSADDTPLRIHLNTLKVTGAELTFEAADGCVQIAGLGSAYMRNPATPFERTLRDLRSAALNYADPPPSRRAVKERET